MRFAVVYPDSFGLRHDSVILAHALRESFPDAVVHPIPLPLSLFSYGSEPAVSNEIASDTDTDTPFDCAFFLEHLYGGRRLRSKRFARRVALVANIEWLFLADQQVLSQGVVDAVLLKNPFSASVFSQLPCASSVRFTRVVGWTSLDVGGSADVPMDFSRALHVRGVSEQKGTEFVLDAWHQHPEFPPLDLVARTRDGRFPLRSFGNVTVHGTSMSDAALRTLQRTCGIHVCPSIAEGFGHSLNEARAVGAVLITTDGPPMRDLVRDGDTGFLVPVRPDRIKTFVFGPSLAFPVTPDDLAETVERALRLSLSARREMGRRAREAFLSDRAAFVSSLRDAVTDLLRDQARAEDQEPREAFV